MADYRNYIRASVAGFDGSIIETATYSGTRFAYTTPTTTAVGRWTPAKLGRNNIASACRVMLQGVINPGDYIRVIDSTGNTRFDLPASVESSGWFFLGPQDVVAISAADATVADILVNDLSDAQLGEFILSEVTQDLGVAAPAPLTTAANPVAVAGFATGTFYLTGTAGAAAVLNLAPVADFGVGARIVFFNNGGGNYTIEPNGAETINGAANIVRAPGSTTSIEAAGTQWIALL